MMGSTDSEDAAFWLRRLEAGDLAAQEQLLRHFAARVERLAIRMLEAFPDLKRWVEAEDVFQNSLVRLLRAKVRVRSAEHFLNLAARQVRFELLDLARYYRRPIPLGGAHESAFRVRKKPAIVPVDTADQKADVERLAAFKEFQAQVAQLPSQDQRLLDYIVFLGLDQAEAAKRLGISEATLKRRLAAIRARLHRLVAETLFD